MPLLKLKEQIEHIKSTTVAAIETKLLTTFANVFFLS